MAVAIYFAAIACAAVFHGRKITSYSTRSPAEYLATLAGMAWMSPALARHLEIAGARCQKRAS